MTLSTKAVIAGGHRVDDLGRAKVRFPMSEVPRVTREIRAVLESWEVGAGTTLFTSGASGADLIAAEQAIHLGAAVHLVLPLEQDEFERRSVAIPGTDWVDRFRRVSDAAETEVLRETRVESVFARANARLVELGRSLDEQVRAILVWNGQRGDGAGGTHDLVARLGVKGPNPGVAVLDPTPRAYEGRQDHGAPKKLLALDGGGIRGALSIEILAALESRLREQFGPRQVLADYFDYIGGTSTGAIIAAALAVGQPVSDIRRKYESLGALVFRPRILPLRLRSLYRDGPLTRELVDFFGKERTLGDPELQTLLLLVLHNANTDSVWPLSNCTRGKYNRADRNLLDPPDRNLDLSLATLIRGSTAAPVYFSPQQIDVGGRPFLFQDGGVTPFNNPAALMFLMATLPEYGLGWPVGEDALLLVSVGTGSSAAIHPGLLARNAGIRFQAKNLPSVFMNGASVGQDLICRSLGRTRAGEPIDREFGTRLGVDGVTGTSAFTYARYNADLSADALAKAGINDPRRQERLRKLDSADCIPELQRLGERAGSTIDISRDFAGFL